MRRRLRTRTLPLTAPPLPPCVWCATQKHPESHIARALRAVILERSGKPAEALSAAEELAALTPTDEHVLHTLTLVWKAAGRTEVRAGAAAGPQRRAGCPDTHLVFTHTHIALGGMRLACAPRRADAAPRHASAAAAAPGGERSGCRQLGARV
jgi:hypothetical protein